ncbi:MAG: pantoate--beta-alanine ligase [Planctomycetota bacterium]|nr:pantoate--beta-alanine ligase [Planctomycetota bacterium]
MPEPVVIEGAGEMQARARELARTGKSIGFVPTMGALHAGHMSLIERARRENDVVVVSIYVNPSQFGPDEDYSRYPRPFEADKALCAAAGVDYIFAPKTLYAEDVRTWVTVGGLEDKLEGLSRPGHFRGVATVVTKLLSIVRPDRAYFGRKDAQQLLIIQVLTRDLDLGCQIVPCETAREPDGLAMSSRNSYLTPSERRQALAIHRALEYCRTQVKLGELDAMKLLGGMGDILSQQPDLEVDYIAIVDADTLEDLRAVQGDVLVAIAAKVGKTRLIDNIRFEEVA